VSYMRSSWIGSKWLASLLLGAFLASGCGYYSFTGASAGHLQSIAIPSVENQTAEFGLAESITDNLLETFTNDGTLKVRDIRTADSILYVTIASINERPAAYNADETVDQYQITVSVRVRFEDRVKGKVAWEETISQFGLYPYTGGSSGDRDAGLEEAAEKIVEDILSKTVSGW